MDYLNFILSRLSKPTLKKFFAHYSVFLTDEENTRLYNQIKRYQQVLNMENYRIYLYDANLAIDKFKKDQIDQVLRRFI